MMINLKNQQLELGASYGLSDSFFAKRPVSRPKIITDLYGKEKTQTGEILNTNKNNGEDN